MFLPITKNAFSKLLSFQTLKHYEGSTGLLCYWRRNMSSATYAYKTLAIKKPHKHILHVELNRPEQRNSMNMDFWREYGECFKQIHKDKECRVVVVSGAGVLFTAGLDFNVMNDIANMEGEDENDIARKAFAIQEKIALFQDSFTSMEKCSKPVITAVHGACVGAGLDLICSADIRYCSEDAWFQAKEVEIGLAADVGTLQRFPRVIGNDSFVREVIYTGRKISSSEALKVGLVSQTFPTREAAIQGAIELAKVIASRSPVAVQGSKINMVYSRDHGVPEGLHFMSHWNMSMLQTEDIMKGAMNVMSRSKEPPEFSDL